MDVPWMFLLRLGHGKVWCGESLLNMAWLRVRVRVQPDNRQAPLPSNLSFTLAMWLGG